MYNEKQQEAINTGLDNVLVLAGAGCGKTSVLVGKVEKLLDDGIPLNRMLIVTYTKKAANELKERLAKKITIEDDWVGTFHSISRRLIIEYGEISNIKLLEGRSDKIKILEYLKGREVPKEEYEELDTRLLKYDIPKDPTHLIHKYIKYCKDNNAMCFNLMMVFSYEYLLNNNEFQIYMNSQFDYILVDEFQDTSKLQYDWLKLLNVPIFAVGDDDQAIYGFRYARIENLQSFLKERDATLIKLEQNYRNPSDIIEKSNNLIKVNPNRLGKILYTTDTSTNNVSKFACTTDKHEADSVVNYIKNLIDTGSNPEEIVILYRTNSQSSLFEEACIEKNIAYNMKGMDENDYHIDFHRRAEIKLVMAYLKVMEGDYSDYLYCINTPSRKIGEVTQTKIYNYSQDNNVDLLSATDAILGMKNPFVSQMRKIMGIPKIHTRVDHIITNFSLIDHYKSSEKIMDRIKTFKNSIKNIDSIHELKINDPNEPKILLSTVHGVKGLEYDNVFVTGMEEMVFPSYLSMQTNEIEEERRLFYVAITRTKKKLFISYAAKRKYVRDESRFLEEL